MIRKLGELLTFTPSRILKGSKILTNTISSNQDEFSKLNEFLFELPYDYSKNDWIVKSYFNRMYNDRKFMEVIECLANGYGYNTDGSYCNFPDMESYDESEHFEGVEFSSGYPPSEADTFIVSEETCYQYTRLACEKYLKLHPEDTEKVNELLAKFPS
ncbi:ribonuclease toxin immunity protein CdiI [Pantoea agglomerans]|uniref:ribonuclease toxin immunity protein CdiI n=1 Tax=Enterobacter agglomerans TaxID=549 RepID=UPI002D7F89F3|nr:ribonuclease toxin immunity protein CdiI [Pantoea agglomerans]